MPINSNKDLPEQITDNLPKHAQEIWRKAYNSALEQYSDQNDPEETAAKVAWSAVKNDYEKNEDGDWVRKQED